MSAVRRAARWVGAGVLVLCASFAAAVAWLEVRDESSTNESADAGASATALIEQGAYLARAGNCMGCHTAAGGASFAGGRGIDTPFGVVMAPNITPDARTGIGRWTTVDFWRAMHQGRSRDGRLLYPAFPYPSYTYVTRQDANALFAYLRSLTPVEQPNAPHALRFPFNLQPVLALWRALYFRPGEFEAERPQGADWNRGKYLVQGLGHCAACHSGRDMLGGIRPGAVLTGGLMPDERWYAPSLSSPTEAGVQRWHRADVVKLLKTGVAAGASVSGPMAEVIFSSTQHLNERDLDAMAQYLASIPVRAPEAPAFKPASRDVLARGDKVYARHCADCHGDAGLGVAGLYPALAGNRAVTLTTAHNVVQMIRHGGFAPTTAGNPRPFGMPPYGQVLDDLEIAAVATFIRQSWGNAANEVSTLDVLRVK